MMFILYDLLEFAVSTRYWRVVVGFFATAALCWLVVSSSLSESVKWVICAPLTLAGVLASVRWHVRAAPRELA
jgi:hypothetical protein